jgi:hypothetical protein
MVYCSKCGRENPSESKYCNACGATLYDGTQRAAKSVDGIASIAEESASSAEESASFTEELTASMEDLTARAQTLSEMALNLQKVASQFKRPAHSKSAGSRAAGNVVAVIAVLVVLAFVFSMITGSGWFGGNAEAQINLRSIHVLNSVTVEVYADNIKIAEETLGPLKTKTITYKKYLLLDDSQTITIKAVARGGGLGTMEDSQTVTLRKGEVVNVHLLV